MTSSNGNFFELPDRSQDEGRCAVRGKNCQRSSDHVAVSLNIIIYYCLILVKLHGTSIACFVTCQAYSVTCQAYSVTCQTYSVTCQTYSVTCQTYSVTCQAYSATCQTYSVACQAYL
ncbi:MAG: DUF4744 domain-containing protein [Hormoscilla sp. GM7CHS1pb]|nr:DUF4744 domain-containing protein [Hormoscilla sp. GM7CHS1pb]